MERSFAKVVSLHASTFSLSRVLLHSWNKNFINTNRWNCLSIVIKSHSHLVILDSHILIFSSRNRMLGKMDLSHDQHKHCYKYICTKLPLPLVRLNTGKIGSTGSGEGSQLSSQASKQIISIQLFFQKNHLPVKGKDFEFSYLVSCSSNSDNTVWVQGTDAVVHQGTTVRTGGNNNVFPSRCFCELKSKGTYAQDSPDCPAQHCISSCLQKKKGTQVQVIVNPSDQHLKHKWN